jgi:hypothetical protein
MIKKFTLLILPLLDWVLAIVLIPSAFLMGIFRRVGVKRLPVSLLVLKKIGVFPIRNHYYEPRFDMSNLEINFEKPRDLPGIELCSSSQLDLLTKFKHQDELELIGSRTNPGELKFNPINGSFKGGDSDVWYQIIRYLKPSRIFEIGSGNSTLLARDAIDRNKEEDSRYACRHVCIEPYERPWLTKLDVEVIREPVEKLELSFFQELDDSDILFIDSSHVIRPGGDVVYEYLHLLPSLNDGVVVHIHDIFSPREYLRSWVVNDIRFWNEQYLLEAFLTQNESWEVLLAVNYLKNDHFSQLKRVAPILNEQHEPGSFYIRKTQSKAQL